MNARPAFPLLKETCKYKNTYVPKAMSLTKLKTTLSVQDSSLRHFNRWQDSHPLSAQPPLWLAVPPSNDYTCTRNSALLWKTNAVTMEVCLRHSTVPPYWRSTPYGWTWNYCLRSHKGRFCQTWAWTTKNLNKLSTTNEEQACNMSSFWLSYSKTLVKRKLSQTVW